MDILVIGLGSMGKRRVRLLRRLRPDSRIIGVDAREDRRAEAAALYGIATAASLDEAFAEGGLKYAFICTSPLSHAALISQCLKRGLHVFTEINLVSDGYGENQKLAEEQGVTLFLSSTPLFRREMNYVTQAVRSADSPISYSYHVGQYLPDWHPWENYTDFFLGDVRTNGCREAMAIELPWICRAFSPIKDIQVKKGKKTALKTPCPDSYLLLLEHENGTQGVLLIDVVSRKAVRNLEVFGEDLYLSWDGTEAGLKRWNIQEKREEPVTLYTSVEKQEGYAAFIAEEAYLNELTAFFDVVDNGAPLPYTFDEDQRLLGLIDRIEGE